MLAKLGCTYVLVGHSERREYHGEDDALVKKVHAAYRHGLVPILCVGEGLEVREAGNQVEHSTGQLLAGLDGGDERAGADARGGLRAGVGHRHRAGGHPRRRPGGVRRAPAALAEKYGATIADGIRILYGGSVKPSNVAEIVAQPDVDGALVGGASLDADGFAQLCAIAAGRPTAQCRAP